MHFKAKFLASAALALVLTTSAQAQSASDVVATVNGTAITLGEMIITRAQLPQQYQALPNDVLFEGILEQLIQQQLLADQLEVEPSRVAIALANEARSLRAGEVITEITETAVSEVALQAAYDAQFADAAPATEFSAAHILVETEEEALAVKADIDGGADFAETARNVSTGPSGPNGGDLGWFSAGMMVAPFEEAVMALEAGDVSNPVETQFGWHVIKLNETREQELPTLDSMREELTGALQSAAIETRLAELQEAAEIALPDEGAFDPELLINLDLLKD
jgi:peptidyl-prolyl cis-trans isomerase C|tara:strand:- start:278 stop:1117 length:840 start_codon:yes stop_codon:yes gene_type:complete